MDHMLDLQMLHPFSQFMCRQYICKISNGDHTRLQRIKFGASLQHVRHTLLYVIRSRQDWGIGAVGGEGGGVKCARWESKVLAGEAKMCKTRIQEPVENENETHTCVFQHMILNLTCCCWHDAKKRDA